MFSLHRVFLNRKRILTSVIIVFITTLSSITSLITSSIVKANITSEISDNEIQIYLPYIVKKWPLLPPSTLDINNINNFDNDGNYIVNWDQDPENSSDYYILEESECTYWCDEFNNPTIVYNGINTTWSTPIEGKSPGTYMYRVRGQNSIGYGDYSEVKLVTVVPDPTISFSNVVAQLDTPEKLSNFLLTEFDFTFHNGCISYWPEEFYNLKNGDCKDYATLSSYILAQNGFQPEIVSYRWYDQGDGNYGHVVVIYQNINGTLQYMSNGEIMEKVTSISDLLDKEKLRLNAAKIGSYIVLPSGTIIVCARD